MLVSRSDGKVVTAYSRADAKRKMRRGGVVKRSFSKVVSLLWQPNLKHSVGIDYGKRLLFGKRLICCDDGSLCLRRVVVPPAAAASNANASLRSYRSFCPGSSKCGNQTCRGFSLICT